MHFLSNELSKNMLHESIIRDIHCDNFKVTLIFDQEYCDLNHNKTGNNKIDLIINGLNSNSAENFIRILKYNRFTYGELSLSKTVKVINKYGFRIDVDYYSDFEKSFLLFGYINNNYVMLKITDINDVLFTK